MLYNTGVGYIERIGEHIEAYAFEHGENAELPLYMQIAAATCAVRMAGDFPAIPGENAFINRMRRQQSPRYEDPDYEDHFERNRQHYDDTVKSLMAIMTPSGGCVVNTPEDGIHVTTDAAKISDFLSIENPFITIYHIREAQRRLRKRHVAA